jgi:two-component system response regulator YesN
VFNVLVAEDEELERDAVCAVVSSAGSGRIALFRAENGLEALRIARESGLDAAFLDIRMPGMDGLEAAREIRALMPGLPIVFLTACDSFDYARKAVSLGIDEYLLKPARDDEIARALERMLRARKAELERREGERERSRIIESTAAYLRSRIEEGLSERRLEERCLDEYAKASLGSQVSLGSQAFPSFLAAFRLPREKAAAMSPGFRRAVFARVLTRVRESCASRGFDPLCGASGEYAFALCLSGNGAARAPGGEQGREIAMEAQRLVMGDFGVCLRSGVACGRLGGLLEAARRAADQARDSSPVQVSCGACPGTKAGEGTGRLAERALAFMSEGMGRDISLAQAAAALRVSPSHLSRTIRAAAGAGFSEVLARMRFEKARELLRSGSSVKEASAVVGFKDPAYFARVFRRLAGMSPTEFLCGGRGE